MQIPFSLPQPQVFIPVFELFLWCYFLSQSKTDDLKFVKIINLLCEIILLCSTVSPKGFQLLKPPSFVVDIICICTTVQLFWLSQWIWFQLQKALSDFIGHCLVLFWIIYYQCWVQKLSISRNGPIASNSDPLPPLNAAVNVHYTEHPSAIT